MFTGSTAPPQQPEFAPFSGLDGTSHSSPYSGPNQQQYDTWPGPGTPNGALNTSSWDGPSLNWQAQQQSSQLAAQNLMGQQQAAPGIPQSRAGFQPSSHPSSFGFQQAAPFQSWQQNLQPQQRRQQNLQTNAQPQNGETANPASQQDSHV